MLKAHLSWDVPPGFGEAAAAVKAPEPTLDVKNMGSSQKLQIQIKKLKAENGEKTVRSVPFGVI